MTDTTTEAATDTPELGNSTHITQELRAQLATLVPAAFSEGKLDVTALQRALGEEASAESSERYTLDWAGKADAYKVLQTPSSATLRPERGQSVDFDAAQHVFIEGENLEVLKVLQKAYFGKVKLIYIDPPYNTGSDSFIYPDRFQESKEDYLRRIDALADDGTLMREGFFRKNSKESGHYHSNWLSMMLPRLYIARNLLREDGVIFVSIDDNEVHNLRCLMNEVFGEENELFLGVHARQNLMCLLVFLQITNGCLYLRGQKNSWQEKAMSANITNQMILRVHGGWLISQRIKPVKNDRMRISQW